MIDVAMLRRLLICDAEAGTLHWRERTPDLFTDGGHSAQHNAAKWNTRYANREGFTALRNAYKVGAIFYRQLYAHRVIWTMIQDRWPIGEIDHIDGNRLNNKISNLREAANGENRLNHGGKRGSSSPYIGIKKSRRKNHWCAAVTHDHATIYVGTFPTPEAAALARDRKARELRGEFARLNFPEMAE